jgi:hypothetical protein
MYSDMVSPRGLMQDGVRAGLNVSDLRDERPLHADCKWRGSLEATEATARDRGQVSVK